MTNKKSVSNEQGLAGTPLYLVLHGEFAIYDDLNPDGGIDVYAPNMPEHTYMAGPWLGEQHIPIGTALTLEGVDSGADLLSNHKDLCLIFKGAAPFPGKAYFAMRLPRPAMIFPLSLTQLFEDSVSGVAALGQGSVSILLPMGELFPANLPQCYVFQYWINTDVQPSLTPIQTGSMDVESSWTAGPTRSAAASSLHVFAANDGVGGPEHAEEAFGLAAELLGVKATLLARQNEAGTLTIPPDDLWPMETQFSIAARVQRIRDLLTDVSSSGVADFISLFEPARVEVNDFFTCGPVGGVRGDG